jgi:hypothetical protein
LSAVAVVAEGPGLAKPAAAAVLVGSSQAQG